MPHDCDGVTKIRLGSDKDGGYVVPQEAIDCSEVLLGCGVDADISFEEEFIKRTGNKAYAIDFSIDHLPKIDTTIKDKIIFCKNRLVSEDTKEHTYDISYRQLLDTYNLGDKKIGLKMDIEGSEYEVLSMLSDKEMQSIQFLAVEFHDICNRHKEVESIFTALEKHMTLIHIHANNYGSTIYDFSGDKIMTSGDIVEFTFVNNIYVKDKRISCEEYPGKLDRKNNEETADIKVTYIGIINGIS